MNTTLFSTYTDAQLLSAIDRAQGIELDLAFAMVAAGRGDESPAVTARQFDELSLRVNNAGHLLGYLVREGERRGLVATV